MCSNGYKLSNDGRNCFDVDECRDNPRVCSGGQCTNTIGSYVCVCTDGLLPGPGGSSCLGKYSLLLLISVAYTKSD